MTHKLIPLFLLTVYASSRPFGDHTPRQTVSESSVTCRGARPFASVSTRCEAVHGPTSYTTMSRVGDSCGTRPGNAPSARSRELSGQSSYSQLVSRISTL